jgi:hypothetical protein
MRRDCTTGELMDNCLSSSSLCLPVCGRNPSSPTSMNAEQECRVSLSHAVPHDRRLVPARSIVVESI